MTKIPFMWKPLHCIEISEHKILLHVMCVSLLMVNFSFCVIAGIQMLTLLVPVLVNCLLEGPALKEANNFNRVLHDQCLQKLMKIGPQYPQV